MALRTKGLRQVVLDDERLALRLMSERRRELVQSRTKTVNHLHQLLMELLPAGAEQVYADPAGHPFCIGWGHPSRAAVASFVADRFGVDDSTG